MATAGSEGPLERRIAEWRGYLSRRQAVGAVDADELEDHLRDQVAALMAAGLTADEAFLVAVKRMGEIDALSREFAQEYSERLWKQLVTSGAAPAESGSSAGVEPVVVVSLAIAAALAVKVPTLFGLELNDDTAGFYGRNLSFFVLPFLTIYFVWKRRLAPATCVALSLAFGAAAVFANIFPFKPGGSTEVLAVLHMPIALWLTVGVAYTGGRRRSGRERMNFVRFTGELFIYYVLIGLGGGVLTGFTMFMFQVIGIDAKWLAGNWLAPCGAMGAVLIGAWLVESKQSVIENMAPVLTRLFTPLFAVLLCAFLATMAWTGSGIDVKREVLIGFDLLLVLVLGLLLYAISARDPQAPADAFDALQLLLVVSALVVDAVALTGITARISEFGFSPNKVAALGENLILLVNLAWSAWLYARASCAAEGLSAHWSGGRRPTCRCTPRGRRLWSCCFRRYSATSEVSPSMEYWRFVRPAWFWKALANRRADAWGQSRILPSISQPLREKRLPQLGDFGSAPVDFGLLSGYPVRMRNLLSLLLTCSIKRDLGGCGR